jgi:uncharacterized protein YecT (DUF1311 family)
MASMLVCASSNLVHASDIDIALSRAERRLNNVYWSIYPTLNRTSQLRLKASELDWIAWKDNLDSYDRLDAVQARIRWLQDLDTN